MMGRKGQNRNLHFFALPRKRPGTGRMRARARKRDDGSTEEGEEGNCHQSVFVSCLKYTCTSSNCCVYSIRGRGERFRIGENNSGPSWRGPSESRRSTEDRGGAVITGRARHMVAAVAQRVLTS